MNKEEIRKFTVEDTTAIKGIAIILLMFYHCFSSQDRMVGNPVIFLFSKEKEMWLCNAANVCVGMFVILSAYGITMASQKYIDNERFVAEYYRHRLVSLLKGFYPVAALTLGISFCLGIDMGYGSGFCGLVYALVEFLGLAGFFGTHMFCGTWWYISFTILLIFLLPLIHYCDKKFGMAGTVGGFFCFVLLTKLPVENMSRWLFAIILGYYAARNQWFGRMERIGKGVTWYQKVLRFCVATLLLCLLMYLRQSRAGSQELSYLTRGIVPLFVVYYCFAYIVKIPGIKQILYFLGKHSMNIFLIHTFIRWIWLRDFIYSFRYPLVIVTVLLFISVVLSIAVEALKKVLHYEAGVQKLENQLAKLERQQ